MQFEKYDFSTIEPALLELWESEDHFTKLREKCKDGKPFYFLDGPPYTSGKVHIGTAWNKSLKDLLVRYRRMQGFDVWDRAGYDMHGLPTEQATEKHLGLDSKDDVLSFGLAKFIAECKALSVRNLEQMNKDFLRLGVSLDFSDAYQTASEEYMDCVWWLVKKAYENGRLYEGSRPMGWDPKAETALAKHELEYRTVEDKSIFVKFKRLDAENEYFIIWTTTPWTIPLNLLIMVNPEASYSRVQVGSEVWVLATDRVDAVLELASRSGEIIETVPGSDLVGASYEHFLDEGFSYDELKAEHPNVHTLVGSKEYVTTDSGSGLVHAAPGCGPEDYEVGVQNDIPAYNVLTTKGVFPDGHGRFSGKTARENDGEFIELYEEYGHIVAIQSYLHEYPFSERSKVPIVYKTTNQWFFKVSDLKEGMVAANEQVQWQPKGGYTAYRNWLENLRDNSITKQRFWGTAFPVWRNVDDDQDIIVVGSKKELEELSGGSVEDMHKPWIDNVVIEKDGKTYKRIPDVIDVWVDAGSATFACLRYPANEQDFSRFMEDFGSDFIVEGRDQIRGWFNLLMVTGMLGLSTEKSPFKNVYMHGMINDTSGRKMSKSLGNYITPDEVVDKFGADACRLYWTGGTAAGNDLNYNFEDCKVKHRNLLVVWNVHRFLLDLVKTYDTSATDVSSLDLDLEENYILSKTHNAIEEVSSLLDQYVLYKIPHVVDELFLTISRTYIQLIRDKVHDGDQQVKVFSVLRHCFVEALKLLAPICPFISDAMWRNSREALGLSEESVHLADYPAFIESFVNTELEQSLEQGESVLSGILAARDKANVGLRWPLGKVEVSGVSLSDEIVSLVKHQANVKELAFVDSLDLDMEIKPDFRAIGKDFGQGTGDIASHIMQHREELAKELQVSGKVTVLGKELVEKHFTISYSSLDGTVFVQSDVGGVLLYTEQTEDLLREGYLRELVRRIQQLRKDGDLEKKDRIVLHVGSAMEDIVKPHAAELLMRVGADKVVYGSEDAQPHTGSAKIKEREFSYGFTLV